MKRSAKHTLAFRRWYQQLLIEKQYYNLFRNTDFNIDLLVEYYEAGKTPIETLNDLSTAT